MRPTLLDSSVYIFALRSEKAALALNQLIGGAILWLSAVVLEELYAGAGDSQREMLVRWQRGFERAGRILVPTLSDWVAAGKVLRRLAEKYDYEKIGRGRLTNDALIAISAARTGIKVITANEKDFRKLEEFCSLSWQVAIL